MNYRQLSVQTVLYNVYVWIELHKLLIQAPNSIKLVKRKFVGSQPVANFTWFEVNNCLKNIKTGV